MIIGANEESGWGCMTHYFDTLKKPHPTLSFTPDGSSLLIFAEKRNVQRGIKSKSWR